MITTIGIIASIVGFCISFYIYRRQHAKKPLMCPRNAPCDTVINSPQGAVFGVSNAGLGVAFYAMAFFFLFCLDIGGPSRIVEILLLLMTAAGFGFSLYLVRIQKDVIKQWCVWCLGSAAMSTILFIVSVLLLF